MGTGGGYDDDEGTFFVSLIGAVLLAACGQEVASVAPAAEQQESSLDAELVAANFAPTGTLRVTYLGANPVHARTDAATGTVTGPIVDLARGIEPADRGSLRAPALFRCAVRDRCGQQPGADIGFLAYEEARAAEVDYAGAYALMHSSYLLPANSPLKNSGRCRQRRHHHRRDQTRSQQIYLSGNIANAEIVVYDRLPPNEDVERLLVGGEVDAFGFNRAASLDFARAFPTLR